MKKASLTGKKKFEVLECPIPEIKAPGSVLLKVNSVGVCGSDIHYYTEGKIGDQIINFPFTIGHECSAVIIDPGDNSKGLKKGDIVAIDPLVACHECSQCKSGREHTCLNQKFLGCPGQLEGCLSEYIIMPEENCFVVPQNVNPELAMLVEPLSIGYYAVQLAYAHSAEKPNNNSYAGILGSGPIGLSVLLFLKAFGFRYIYVTDKLDYRLDIASSAGAVWTGNPDKEDIVQSVKNKNPDKFDYIFECCGKQEAIDQAVELLKPGGMLLLVGIPETDFISFNISKIRRKEITIQNVRRQNKSVQPVIDLISSGRISPGFMITHRFPIDKTSEAFDIVSNYKDGVVKALIKI